MHGHSLFFPPEPTGKRLKRFAGKGSAHCGLCSAEAEYKPDACFGLGLHWPTVSEKNLLISSLFLRQRRVEFA